MQFPITIGLRRSFLLSWACWLLFGMATVIVLCLLSWPWQSRLPLVLLLLVTGWNWRKRPVRPVVALQVRSAKKMVWQLEEDGQWIPVTELLVYLVHPWMVVCRLGDGARKINLVIVPDMADREAMRRLRVWLRWRRKERFSV